MHDLQVVRSGLSKSVSSSPAEPAFVRSPMEFHRLKTEKVGTTAPRPVHRSRADVLAFVQEFLNDILNVDFPLPSYRPSFIIILIYVCF